MINTKALQKTMEEVLNSTYLTEKTELEVKKFIEEGIFDNLSFEAKKELAFIYWSLILPIYQQISGEYLPNIFISLEGINA